MSWRLSLIGYLLLTGFTGLTGVCFAVYRVDPVRPVGVCLLASDICSLLGSGKRIDSSVKENMCR